MNKIFLLVSVVCIALFIVGCDSRVGRTDFCNHEGFDYWKYEDTNAKYGMIERLDFDIICYNVETQVPNSQEVVNHTEHWFSNYDFQVWQSQN